MEYYPDGCKYNKYDDKKRDTSLFFEPGEADLFTWNREFHGRLLTIGTR